MAISNPTTIGTVSDAVVSGSDPVVLTTSVTAAANSEVVVLIGATGNRSVSSVTDSAGNTYTSMVTANSGSFATDTKVQEFRSKLASQLSSGGTITINNSGIGTGGVVAEAVKFTGAVNATDATGTGSGNSGDPSCAIDPSAAVTVALAVVVQLAALAPTYDEDAAWTSLTGVDAVGSLSLSLHTAYRQLSSGDALTYDPATPGTSVEWSAAVATLAQAPLGGYLPLLGVG